MLYEVKITQTFEVEADNEAEAKEMAALGMGQMVHRLLYEDEVTHPEDYESVEVKRQADPEADEYQCEGCGEIEDIEDSFRVRDELLCGECANVALTNPPRF